MSALLMAIVSGLLMSLIGVAFGMGGARGVQPPHIAIFMGFCGLPVFACMAGMDALRAAPASVWWIGVAAGVTQYLGVCALGAALRRGPLSPAWCAAAMIFLPVLAYARLALDQRIGGCRLAGVALACVCVALAAWQGGSRVPGTAASPRDWRTTAVYGLLLVVIVINASSLSLAITMLGAHTRADGRTQMDAFGLVMLAACYAAFGVCMLADTLARPPPVATRRLQWTAGLLASVGSVGGFALLRHAASAPAAMVFPANSVASLLGASVVSVLFFRERVTPVWIGMLVAGVAAVVLVGL